MTVGNSRTVKQMHAFSPLDHWKEFPIIIDYFIIIRQNQ